MYLGGCTCPPPFLLPSCLKSALVPSGFPPQLWFPWTQTPCVILSLNFSSSMVNTALLLLRTLLFRVFPFLPEQLPACSGFHPGSFVLPKDPGSRQLGSIWWQSNSSTCNSEWENMLKVVISRSIYSIIFSSASGLNLSFLKYFGLTVDCSEPY